MFTMFPKDNKRAILRWTILVRNNETDKHKSVRFDEFKIRNEGELLNLIKELLIGYFKKKDIVKTNNEKEN